MRGTFENPSADEAKIAKNKKYKLLEEEDYQSADL